MIKVIKEPAPGGGLNVVLSGTFEETADLDTDIGPFQGPLTVNCRGITRINSVGVKAWIRYFQKIKSEGHSFRFEECSPALVEQINLISTFTCGGEIGSILLPYSCTKCMNDFVVPCTLPKLKELNLQAPAVKCEKTDCRALFDDDPDEYFYFLQD